MADTYIHQSPKTAKPFIGTRDDARANGAVRYCDGASCRRGHSPTIRLTSNMACVACRDMKASEYLASHAAERKAWRKSYESANKEMIRDRNAAWVAANYEKHRESCDRWLADNKDRAKATQAAYREANRDRENQRATQWGIANQERKAQTTAKWQKENPEQRCANEATRRARKRGADGNHTKEDILEIFDLQRGRCAYCRTSLKAGYHVDHIMPLALGGSNRPNNLQLLCSKHNLEKSAKDPLDFARQKFGLLL